MKIIDSHIHFWKFDPVRDAWITNDMAVLQRDFLPQDVSGILAENAVSGCMAVQADQSDEETRFLLSLAAGNDFIKGVVGWIDLAAPDIDARLETYKAVKSLKGFRHIAEGEPQGFLLRTEIISGIKELGAAGYTYDILVRGHLLDDALKLSGKLPGVPFMIDHCAKPALRSNNIAQWKAQVKELAQNPGMYCKLSGLLTEDHWHNCNEVQLHDCLDTVFSSFGTTRIVYGSDWPVLNIAGNYAQWLSIVKRYIAGFSLQEQQNILAGNAERFYNL